MNRDKNDQWKAVPDFTKQDRWIVTRRGFKREGLRHFKPYRCSLDTVVANTMESKNFFLKCYKNSKWIKKAAFAHILQTGNFKVKVQTLSRLNATNLHDVDFIGNNVNPSSSTRFLIVIIECEMNCYSTAAVNGSVGIYSLNRMRGNVTSGNSSGRPAI